METNQPRLRTTLQTILSYDTPTTKISRHSTKHLAKTTGVGCTAVVLLSTSIPIRVSPKGNRDTHGDKVAIMQNTSSYIHNCDRRPTKRTTIKQNCTSYVFTTRLRLRSIAQQSIVLRTYCYKSTTRTTRPTSTLRTKICTTPPNHHHQISPSFRNHTH